MTYNYLNKMRFQIYIYYTHIYELNLDAVKNIINI